MPNESESNRVTARNLGQSHRAMITTAFVCLVGLQLFGANGLAALDELYTNPSFSLRTPAAAAAARESSAPPSSDSVTLPKEFIVSAPDRSPAANGRRSRLPPGIQNGFELRVQYNRLTSMFWVVERAGQHDLIYANSAGSKSSIGLSSADFSRLQRTALSFKPHDANIATCKNSSMQLYVVAAQSPERSTSMCVSARGQAATQLRALAQGLANLVR